MSETLDFASLRADLKADEGTGPIQNGRLMPYFDCCGKLFRLCRCSPQGKLTIGHGRNIEDRGISFDTANQMLDEDIVLSADELSSRFYWYRLQTPARRRVLINLHFNLGLSGLSKFRKFLRAAEMGDHDTAANELLDSKAARDAPRRYLRLAQQWRQG